MRQENHAAALASVEKHKAWGEALATKLHAAGTDLAALEAERIAALWKPEAPLQALQQRADHLQSQLIAAQTQATTLTLTTQMKAVPTPRLPLQHGTLLSSALFYL